MFMMLLLTLYSVWSFILLPICPLHHLLSARSWPYVAHTVPVCPSGRYSHRRREQEPLAVHLSPPLVAGL